MKKQTIWIITTAMSIALLGLISFQIYWISSTINLNQERFNRDVYESLSFVVDQLEKEEILAYTSRAINKLHPISEVLPVGPPRSPKPKDVSYRKVKTSKGVKVIYKSKKDTVYEEMILEVETNELETEVVADETGLLIVKRHGDTISYAHSQDVEVEEDNIKKKFEIFDAVMEEILHKERKIKRKIDLGQIDSLINAALNNKGIDTKYEFAIWNDRTSNAILPKEEKPSENLFETQFKASLFPNDVISSSEYLLLNFPNQESFIFNQMWGSLIASFILVIIILTCFGYSLFTIIRQKKISEIKNDFINNITHEFKTPIATVSLACEALQEQEVLNDPVRSKRYLSMIKEENTRLENHVEKVLQLATLDRQTVALHLEPLDLHDIIENVLAAFDIQILSRKGSLLKKLSATRCLVNADIHHITNLISNLLDNAIKYSPESPTITITSKSDEQNLYISITDKGIGMSKDELKKVFDKFYRVPTGNLHNVKGFGLGLSYVRDIAEMHNGSINAHSDMKHGSTFTLTLPLNT